MLNNKTSSDFHVLNDVMMVTCQRRRQLCIMRLKKVYLTVTVNVILALVIIYNVLVWSVYRVWLPNDVVVSEYPPFEPKILEDFPILRSDSPVVPHILHQAHVDEMIPVYFKNNVKAFPKLNPKWDYFFWTDASARKLISDKHAYLLPFWDSYWTPRKRNDAVRYIVLYEYGGVFADLGVEFLRPLDRLTYKYSCILSPEPFEPIAIEQNLAYRITNAIMLCRPKHPFFKRLLQELATYSVMESVPDATGSSFLTSQFIAYNTLQEYFNYSNEIERDNNSPYFRKGSHAHAIYIANSKYFANRLSDWFFHLAFLFRKCSTDFDKMLFHQKRGCIELINRDLYTRNEYAFTEFCVKTISKDVVWLRDIIFGHVDVRSLVSECKIYTDGQMHKF